MAESIIFVYNRKFHAQLVLSALIDKIRYFGRINNYEQNRFD